MTAPISYSLATASEACGLSKSALRQAIRSGHLRAKRSSADADGNGAGNYVILRDALEAYIDSLVDA